MQVMIENKVPMLRFRDFKEPWQENKLGNIATFYNSKRVALTASDRKKGEYPYYGASGIIDYVKDFIFEGEYILLGEDGANIVMRNSRLVFLAKGKFWLNNHAHIFQSKDSNAFLCEALERINYTKYNTGTAQPKLNSDVVKKIKLNLPSLPEQKKIATFLSAVDEKLQQLTKKKELLEDYKKGVMQKIFSQELRFKDNNGNNYPDWEEKKMGEIGETFNGLTGKTKEDFGRGKPFIQYMQIFNSAKIDTSKFGYVDIKEGEKQKTAQYGDVFFTTSSETPIEIGYASVLTEEIEGLYLNSFCFGYRPNSLNELYPDFASYLFRSESLRKQIVKLAQGSTRYNMSKVQLMKVLIQLPSLDEQQKIANFLSSLDSKIDLVSTQIENTKSFKKGLLQQMFV